MRLFRISGFSLLTLSSLIILRWFLDTLIPIHRVSTLEPIQVQSLDNTALGTPVLVECAVSEQPPKAAPSTFQVNCMGQLVQVEDALAKYKNLSMGFLDSRLGKAVSAIAAGDPVVVIGTLAKNHSDRVIDAELVTYGNRQTYITELRNSSTMLVIAGYSVGGLGLLSLLLDWRMAKARRDRQTEQALKLLDESIYPSPQSPPPAKPLRPHVLDHWRSNRR